MPSLRELQAAFRRAVLGGDEALIADAVDGGELGADTRVEVYRSHVQASLVKALETSYPVVQRLVGAEFFTHAAGAFVARHPPRSAYLLEYGAAFAPFLETFPPAAPLVYLGDVARLEWAIHAVYHAPDTAPVDPAPLRALDPRQAPRLRFRFRPSVAYIESRWPIERIWRANRPGRPEEDAMIDLESGGALIEIRQQGDGVAVHELSPAVFAFRHALAEGESLEAASAAAFSRDADFDLAVALRALLREEVIAGFEIGSADSDGG